MIRQPKWMMFTLALVLLVGLVVPALAAEMAKGKIKSVAADKQEFVLTDTNNKDWTFHLDDKATVRLNEKAGKLNDLKAGDEVEIKYEKKGERLIAQEVNAQRK